MVLNYADIQMHEKGVWDTTCLVMELKLWHWNIYGPKLLRYPNVWKGGERHSKLAKEGVNTRNVNVIIYYVRGLNVRFKHFLASVKPFF